MFDNYHAEIKANNSENIICGGYGHRSGEVENTLKCALDYF